MTFEEKYDSEPTWHGKVIVMEIFHLAMISGQTRWTVKLTATYFGVSAGLVSENLRLANAIHLDPTIVTIPHRQDALKKINGGSYGRNVETTAKRSSATLD